MRILVTGATGFIGKRLCEVLHRGGHAVVALVRNPAKAHSALNGRARVVGWDPRDPKGEWAAEVAQVDGIVNLAGEPVIGRWTEQHKKAIHDSRILATRAIVDAIEAVPVDSIGRNGGRPRVLVQASAVGYYGETTKVTDEDSPSGRDFLAKVCVDWEKEAMRAEALGTKVVICRLGVVLGKGGGALPQMALPFKMFAGGPIGDGKQWVPWVALDDVLGMLEMALFDANVTGPINVVAPEPNQNREIAKTIGHLLGRPSFMPTPGAALRLVFGEGADILLKGTRAVPKRAIELEYPFRHPTLRGALKAGLGIDD